MKMYVYSPLTRGNAIRVLKVQGCDDKLSKPICSLETVDPKQTKYFAISYCWEDQIPNQEIEVDGRDMLVTENAYAALQRFRDGSEDPPVPLWIDGVCINQSDSKEKCRQVSLMASIYSQARAVLVWLRHSRIHLYPKDRPIMEWIKELAEIGKHLDGSGIEKDICKVAGDSYDENGISLSRDISDNVLHMEAIRELSRHIGTLYSERELGITGTRARAPSSL